MDKPHSIKQEVNNPGSVAGSISQTINAGPVPIKLVPPPLDTAWVERPPYQELKAALLNQGDIQRTNIVSAVHGMGGIGKTWMARALANDPDIRNAMGVLWHKVGQETLSSDAIMSDLIAQLAPSQPRMTTHDGIRQSLRGLLSEKQYLLVLDDVWTKDIAADFKDLFAKNLPSLLVITTRKTWMADELGANSFPLGLMTEGESLILFENQLGRSLQPDELSLARSLAKLVKYLPLALSLVIARIRKTQNWSSLIEQLDKSLGALNQNGPHRPGQRAEPTLEAVFNTSLSPLRDVPDFRPYWEGFIRLSVLAEDTQVTPSLALRLLGEQGSGILELLADEALLTRIQEGQDVYQMHDLLLDHARGLLKAPPPLGLGETLEQAERKLLARYGLDVDRKETFVAAWQLEDDGYIYDRLVYHLSRLDQPECIEVVLNTETPDGKNGWFQAHETLGQTSEFVTDVEQWWEVIRARNKADEDENTSPRRMSQEVRCVLMLSTIRSLVTNIGPVLLERLLSFSIWKPEQALTYVQQVVGDSRKSQLLKVLFPLLPTELFQRALAATLSIENELARARTLIELIPHLPIHLHQHAWQAAQSINEEYLRFEASAAIVSKQSLDQQFQSLEQILISINIIGDETYRFFALAATIHQLPPQKAWEAVQNIQTDYLRIWLLSQIAPTLPVKLLRRVVSDTKKIEKEHMRLAIMGALAPYLPSRESTMTMVQILKDIEVIEDERQQARILVSIIPRLPPFLLQLPLKIANKINNKYHQSSVLVAIAPRLPQEQAWEIVREIEDDTMKYNALVATAPMLRDKFLVPAWEMAETINDTQHRSDAQAAIASNLPVEEASQNLRKILDDVVKIKDDYYIISTVLAYPSCLSPEKLQQVLELAQNIKSKYLQSSILVAMVTFLPEEQALDIAEEIKESLHQCAALVNISLKMKPEQRTKMLQRAWEIAKTIDKEHTRAKAMTLIIPHLPLAQRYNNLEEILNLSKIIKDEHSRSETLVAVASLLTPTLLTEALKIAANIVEDHCRFKAVAAVASQLPLEQRVNTLQRLLKDADNISKEILRTKALAAIAPYLSPSQGLEIAMGIQEEPFRSDTLAEIAPHLAAEEGATIWQKILQNAKNTPSDLFRSGILRSVSTHMCGHNLSLCYQLLDAASLEEREDALRIIAGLATALQEIGGRETVCEIARAILDVGRWWT